MKINRMLTSICAVILTLSLAGCAGTNNTPETASSQVPAENVQKLSTTTAANAKGGEDDGDTAWKSNLGTITLGDTITYHGTGISVAGSTVTITAGGDYTVTGTLTDGQILVNSADKVKLRLNGVDITCSTGPAIFFNDSKKSFITLEENTTNTLTDGKSYTDDAKAALFSNDTLEIKGNGALIINGNYKHGIASDDDIIIENGTIQITAMTDGIHANDSITVNGGNLTITGGSDGIGSEGDVIINEGMIDIAKSEEGIESKTMMTINGGGIKVKASDDGLNAGTGLIINGGDIYIDCEGDGIDSNGDLTITGGNIKIFSGNNANGALDIGERNAAYVITGGTVTAIGGNMGIAVSDSSTQYSLWIGGNFAANTAVSIADANGTELDSFTPIKNGSLIYYSSDKLTTGESYTATAGGNVLGSATMSAKSANIGNVSAGFGGRGGGMGKPGGMVPPEGMERPARG